MNTTAMKAFPCLSQGERVMTKCSYGEGITVKPDGVNELDPCRYREVQVLKNVTLHILECIDCGNIDLEWERQEDTEDITECESEK